ncbi:MAG: selenocysteine-specific translation elongation factor [bacterium]|nr:selenocysteine-specific translation elongation factor [bacterium]
MPNRIIGTAGHIDHGKTSIVHALTGIDTDRLKEEQEREITIDLGFAFLDQNTAFIDVPGHEKFVRNMVAGVSGIDLALLVIAADDGIMPQTLEHLDIIRLLKIEKLAVALSKIDLVEPDWIELVLEEIRTLLDPTEYKSAPVIPISTETREGIDNLREVLISELKETDESSLKKPFRMPVDRSFSMTGFGTVVTGTVISGELKNNSSVDLLPSGKNPRVRGIQTQGDFVEKAGTGIRTAVNLSGIQKKDVIRGDVISEEGYFKPSMNLNCYLHYLASASKPLKFRDRIRYHSGTVEAIGRIILLEKDLIQPGEDFYAQIQLEKPVVPAVGDRFIIRQYSPPFTVGGGEILEIDVPRPRRNRKEIAAFLKKINGKSLDKRLIEFVVRNGLMAMSTREYAGEFGLFEENIRQAFKAEPDKISFFRSEGEYFWFSADAFNTLMQKTENAVLKYHAKNPEKPNIKRLEIIDAVGKSIHDNIWKLVFEKLDKKIIVEKDRLKHADFKPELSGETQKIYSQIEQFIKNRNVSGPNIKELTEELKIDGNILLKYLRNMIDSGIIVRIDNTFYYLREEIERIGQTVADHIRSTGSITIAGLREILGTSRKYSLPLLNHFDETGLTIRQGDERILK